MQPQQPLPHILLTFGTSLGRTRTLRISNADTGTVDTAVRNTMDRVIGTQAVVSERSGLANSRRRATLVESFITPIDIGV